MAHECIAIFSQMKQFKGIPKVVEHIKSEKQFLEFDKKVLK